MDYFDIGLEIISKISSLGYEAYLVGGCVRDYLLKIETNDIDITTNIPLSMLEDYFVIIDNGSKYESVTIDYKNLKFEITHFRRDISYSDHRHPIVEFTDDIILDSKRRDFTINALYMDSNKNIKDFHNGLADLENKSIKAIGDPNLRFDEDALRILRALYFSSKLNFDIESNTLFGMYNNAKYLANLSDDRIYQYFIKLIKEDNKKGIKYIEGLDLFSYIPEYRDFLNVTNSYLDDTTLGLLYYHKYKKPSPHLAINDKTLNKALEDLINENFSNISLYNYRDKINLLFNTLKYLNYDIIYIGNKLDALAIKSDNDLAVSAKEITDHFNGNKKSIALNAIRCAILDRKIENNRDSINEFIRGLLDEGIH